MRLLAILGVCAALTAPAAATDVYVDNVVIVLDGSGSMRDAMRSSGVPKIKAAKDALYEVLAQLPPTTHVGLLAFSSRSSEPWLYPLGPQDLQQLKAAIDPLRADGGTPLGSFMKKGADRLLKQRAAQYGYGAYRLLVVTDGEASDPQVMERYTPEILSRGVTVDVIGVDMKQDHTLATKVHSYRRADDPQSLRQAIQEVLAEFGGATDDIAEAEAFELIAPLPIETAAAMITALADSGNEPIGARASQPAAGRRASAPTNRQASPSVPVSKTQTSDAYSVVMAPCCCGVVVIGAVLAIVLSRSMKKRR